MNQTSPTTVIARWTRCDTQSAVPILAEKIRAKGNPIGRWSIMIRGFRLPSSTAGVKGSNTSRIGGIQQGGEQIKDDGRNMYIVRSNSSIETGYTFIEDKAAPVRLRSHEGMESKESKHYRWTSSSLGTPNSGPVPFDILLQRVLCTPPNKAKPSIGAWAPRTSHILIEGYIFSVGQTSLVAGDWIIKVGGVQVKGGGAGGRGVVVEATYLPVPHLPANSTFIQDFLIKLFPAPSVAAGDISFLTVNQDSLHEAGLINTTEDDESEWTELHSAFDYVKAFQAEGLL